MLPIFPLALPPVQGTIVANIIELAAKGRAPKRDATANPRADPAQTSATARQVSRGSTGVTIGESEGSLLKTRASPMPANIAAAKMKGLAEP